MSYEREDHLHQRFTLPRSDGQAIYVPQSYMYDASRGGAYPAFDADEDGHLARVVARLAIWRKTNSSGGEGGIPH